MGALSAPQRRKLSFTFHFFPSLALTGGINMFTLVRHRHSQGHVFCLGNVMKCHHIKGWSVLFHSLPFTPGPWSLLQEDPQHSPHTHGSLQWATSQIAHALQCWMLGENTVFPVVSLLPFCSYTRVHVLCWMFLRLQQ